MEALGVVGAPPLGLRYLRMAGRETPTESASSCMFTLLPWALLPFMRYARRLRKMSFMVSSPAVGTKVSAASNTRSRLCLGSLGGLGSRGGLGSLGGFGALTGRSLTLRSLDALGASVSGALFSSMATPP